MSWREYIVCHKEAREIIGEGIVNATAEAIQGARDPDRSGQLRIDFVFYRADGSHCRLHPGSKIALDAKVRYFEAQRTASSATEHAASGSFTALAEDLLSNYLTHAQRGEKKYMIRRHTETGK